jgi:hypothetical protein
MEYFCCCWKKWEEKNIFYSSGEEEETERVCGTDDLFIYFYQSEPLQKSHYKKLLLLAYMAKYMQLGCVFCSFQQKACLSGGLAAMPQYCTISWSYRRTCVLRRSYYVPYV